MRAVVPSHAVNGNADVHLPHWPMSALPDPAAYSLLVLTTFLPR
jgi:hypothetical protein